MMGWNTDARRQHADAVRRIRGFADRHHRDAVSLVRQTGMPRHAVRATLAGFGPAVPQRHLDQGIKIVGTVAHAASSIISASNFFCGPGGV